MGYLTSRTNADAEHRSGLTRTRWAAIGAAVAVTLGAGGLGIAQATVEEGEMPVYIAIEPCRLVDTRPEFLVGGRATPLNADETYTLVGTGEEGNCNVPAGVASLALNVTALNASAPTFLRFAPGNTVPAGEGSSLNPVPGAPPTPNAVTTSIDDEGEFSVYNLAGTVDVIIDVVGYFDDHMHTGADIVDESLTGDDIDNGTITRADILDEPGLAYDQVDDFGVVPAAGSPASVADVLVRAPSSGFVTVQATAQVYTPSAGLDNLLCTLTDGAIEVDGFWTMQDNDDDDDLQILSIHRTFDVAEGNTTFRLVCGMFGGSAEMENIELTATYVPTWRGNFTLPPFVTIPPIVISP